MSSQNTVRAGDELDADLRAALTEEPTDIREGGRPVKIHLLVMHRRENYPGQYGPEVLAVVDQWTLDENPEWWDAEIARQKSLVGDDAAAWATVTAVLDRDELMSALYPLNEVRAVLSAAPTSTTKETDR